jgi:hypothetical protein
MSIELKRVWISLAGPFLSFQYLAVRRALPAEVQIALAWLEALRPDRPSTGIDRPA